MIFPGSMAMITIVFPEEQRGVALGIYGTIGTIFLTIGPLVGGLFTDLLSWRWIFWINPPVVAAVALVVLAAWVDPPRATLRTMFDYRGLITLAGGLGMLVFAIMQGPDWGWSQPSVLFLLVAGSAALAIFVVVELHAKAPLIEVGLFRIASFTASNLVCSPPSSPRSRSS